MNKDEEKRSSTTRTDQASVDIDVRSEGVGGRQAESQPPAGGGGYQDNCLVLNFRPRDQKNRDPRINELREMGLQRHWIDVAETIGVDNFMAAWRILDAEKDFSVQSGRMMIPLRAYSAYLRYQRNRYIETLASMGVSLDGIRARLKDQLCENISRRHITRLKGRG